MSQVLPFHDRNEPDKATPRYHTDDACPMAQHISPVNVRPGSGGFSRCEQCAALALQRPRRETRCPNAPIS